MSTFYHYAIQLYNNKKYDDALEWFIRSLKEEKRKEDSIGACYYISLCYMNKGDNENRLNYLLRSFLFDNPRAEICCQLGYCFMENNDFIKAIFWFDFAAKLIKPVYCEFYIPDYWGYIPNLQLCVCHDRLKNLNEAIKYNEIAAEYMPNSPAVLYNRKYFKGLLIDRDLKAIEEQKKLIVQQREKYKEYSKPGASLILSTNKPEYMANIFDTYERLDYETKELIIILHNKSMSIEEYRSKAAQYEGIKVFQLDESYTLGECLNYAIDNAKYDYIAKLDDDDFYGRNYLIDQMNVFNYTDADVTGKSKRFIHFESNNTLWIMKGLGEDMDAIGTAGGTILAKRKVFDKIEFRNVNAGEDEAFFNDCRNNGFKIYSNNKFNYVYKRHKNMENHAWKIADEYFKDVSTQVKFVDGFEEIVTV